MTELSPERSKTFPWMQFNPEEIQSTEVVGSGQGSCQTDSRTTIKATKNALASTDIIKGNQRHLMDPNSM